MTLLFFALLTLALIFVATGFIALFAGPKGRGVPFIPTSRKNVEAMLRLAGDVRGKKVVDLGSGDGRLVIAFAKAGAEVHGYELNPVLVLSSSLRIRFLGLNNAHVHWGDFWGKNFAEYDVVVVYLFQSSMHALEKKLAEELRPGAAVLSNTFTFADLKPEKSEGSVYLYRL